MTKNIETNILLYKFKDTENEKLALIKKGLKKETQVKQEIEKLKSRLLENEAVRKDFLKDRGIDACVVRRIRDSVVASNMYMHENAREEAKARFMNYVSFRSEKFHLKSSYVSFIK